MTKFLSFTFLLLYFFKTLNFLLKKKRERVTVEGKKREGRRQGGKETEILLFTLPQVILLETVLQATVRSEMPGCSLAVLVSTLALTADCLSLH